MTLLIDFSVIALLIFGIWQFREPLRAKHGNMTAALALFLLASVHVALMAMVLKVAGSVVSGWQVFGLGADRKDTVGTAPAQAPTFHAGAPVSAQAASAAGGNRAAAVFVQGADSAAQ